MSNKISEIVFVLDKSGSMYDSIEDTIGGFNSTLNQQKQEKGKAYLTTCLFDSDIHYLHDHLDINDVKELTSDDYNPGGCTALLEAIGETINKIDNIVKQNKAENVVFIIITDGLENASKTYSNDDIKKLISQKEELGWSFIFLGANIDSFAVSSKMGIKKERTANFIKDSDGFKTAFHFMSSSISSVRNTGVLDEDNIKKVNNDYQNRK